MRAEKDRIAACFAASSTAAPREDLWAGAVALPRRQRQGPRVGRGGRLQQRESPARAAPGPIDLGDATGAQNAPVALPRRRWWREVLRFLRANRRCCLLRPLFR